SYAAPILAGVVDGTDVTVGNASNPVLNRARQSNYAQAFRRDLRIGFIAETQNVAGVTDELANGISKKLIEIKRADGTRGDVSDDEFLHIGLALRMGYQATWCAGAAEAIGVINDYLAQIGGE
ncbi:MAG: hypothetical protein VW362_13175, partial [Candidatus Nanopelagicales bacterium]